MLDETGTTIGHIALHLCDTGLFEFDDRYARVLGIVRDAADAAQEPEAADAVPA
jgi:DNA helicase-2/ATP-dependent DNA helicase PcrA